MVILELQEGDRAYPLIIHSIPLTLHQTIAFYHGELSRRYRAITGYWEVGCDRILFEAYGEWYRAIASRLPEPFDPAHLSPEQRHRFFISDGMAPHPMQPDQSLPGLSQVEKLLGIGYVKDDGRSGGIRKAVITTGDPILDLVADCHLAFEENAPWLMERFDAGAIARLIVQKIDRQRGKEAIDEKQAEIDKQWFIENEARVMQMHSQGGV